ncbi:hypothetical protein [Saliphagus infecundisoli]|uniref:Plasmid replication protein RepH n=1 Tax=Saliphagus infecundisoli TaxID=1849069 RepID=A0ABD5QIK5_9EURY|nr:hypothetical protein [Saliphagus infecundisoli]
MTDESGAPTNAGLRAVGPLGQASLSDVIISDVGPRRSSWLPDALDELLPTTSRAIRELVGDHDPRVFADKRLRSSFVREVLLDDVINETGEVAIETADAGVALESYLESLTRYALEFDGFEAEIEDWPRQYRQQRVEDIETITTIGTGRGKWNAGLPVLEHGFCEVHRRAEIAPTVLLLLDGQEWLSVDDNRTIQSALDAITLLGEVLDLRLVLSPSLERYLEQHFQSFCEDVVGLTEERDASTTPPPVSADPTESDLLADAWDRLCDLDGRGEGRLRLLANLDPDSAREHRDLKQDDEIDLAAGSVDRYVGDLESIDLVTVDDSSRYNTVSLSPLGETALEFITDDYSVRHPLQSQLDAPYADPPFDDKYSVSPEDEIPPQDGQGDEDSSENASTAEEWLAQTGNPDDGAAYVQWIDGGPSETLDAWAMHDRLAAGRRVEGVNLVDHEISEFEDGRIAQLSCFEDDAQVVVQWGGSLPTLARLPAALLSDRAFSKILEPSAVGSAFENLFEDHLEEEIEAVIQRGMQIGWFSEDELQYESWRKRWGHVRTELLQRLGEAVGTRDYELRQELYNDLHGLLASATALYRSLGIDVTIHIRMPDTAMLRDDETRLGDFLSFMRHTVPKQTAYGIHSGNRMLLEDRRKKLRQRLPYDVQADDPTMDLTASWVVSGPQASLLQEDLENAIGAADEDVREAIQEGAETAPTMEIPVVVANEFGAIKSEISRHLERKGFRQRHDNVVSLTRACMAVLGTETRGASPFDVAEALLHLKKKPGLSLSLVQLENALAMLPADRLLRGEKATVQKMVKALLEADDPLGRKELIEAAGISENSYDRNWRDLRTLEAFGLVDRLNDKRWQARLIPFWSDVGSKSSPEDLKEWEIPSTWSDVLFEAVFVLGRDDDVDVNDLFSWPQNLAEILRATEWEHWGPMLIYLFDGLFENRQTAAMRGPGKIVGDPRKRGVATIGRRPTGTDPKQSEIVEKTTV